MPPLFFQSNTADGLITISTTISTTRGGGGGEGEEGGDRGEGGNKHRLLIK